MYFLVSACSNELILFQNQETGLFLPHNMNDNNITYLVS